MFQFTDSVGKPVTQVWVVRQVYPQAACVDQAHRGLGVWSLPSGAREGRAEVVVETAWRGQPAQKDTITWMPR